ncbi:hypothetical protein VKT23_004624 [Stygiomarasmius scandens]|uniref:Uncharacterized protein n=1 Tax=Marasmiellus scandens TaxID=2682957 RepID=A0ABR1JYX9_9AGAR
MLFVRLKTSLRELLQLHPVLIRHTKPRRVCHGGDPNRKGGRHSDFAFAHAKFWAKNEEIVGIWRTAKKRLRKERFIKQARFTSSFYDLALLEAENKAMIEQDLKAQGQNRSNSSHRPRSFRCSADRSSITGKERYQLFPTGSRRPVCCVCRPACVKPGHKLDEHRDSNGKPRWARFVKGNLQNLRTGATICISWNLHGFRQDNRDGRGCKCTDKSALSAGDPTTTLCSGPVTIQPIRTNSCRCSRGGMRSGSGTPPHSQNRFLAQTSLNIYSTDLYRLM